MDLTGIKTFTDKVASILKLPVNTENQLLSQKDGVFTATPTVIEMGIVETDPELEAQKGQNETFTAVFDRWKRISRSQGTPGDKSHLDELETWQYNVDSDTIECTKNTSSLVGFVSPDSYEDYVLEVEVNSAAADDDYIGVIIAYATDNAGETHVLTAMRQLNSSAPLTIEKNRGTHGANTGPWFLNVYNGLQWADGAEATQSIESGIHGGWSTIDIPYKIKITREGDVITVETTNTGETTYFEPAKTVIDLTNEAELEVFRGAQRFGYCCLSQPQSTWLVLQRPGTMEPIYDIPNQRLWRYINDVWQSEPATVTQAVDVDILTRNWLHYNPQTDVFYYLEPGDNLVKV